MKTRFSNHELPHIWASQGQEEGTGSNLFFEGDTIYSYGKHYPAAKLFGDMVLLNSESYSNSTSKQMFIISQAVNHKKCIYVPEPEVFEDFSEYAGFHQTNIKHFLELIETYSAKHLRARKYSYEGEINNAKDDLLYYCKYFKLKLTREQKKLVNSEIKEVAGLVLKREKKESAKQKRKALERAREFTGDPKAKTNKTEIYLRTDGENVYTSAGAVVPVPESKVLLERIRQGKDIKGFKIGYYTVISINGVLTIGCHQITRQEIKRFTEFYNW